nr:MAG TPA: hypothetical protein [Caudoviricetes sp.]
MMAKMKQSFYKNLPAIEDTENNIPPATGKIEKNAGDGLTGTAECATLSVKGLNNPGTCGRCLRQGSNSTWRSLCRRIPTRSKGGTSQRT